MSWAVIIDTEYSARLCVAISQRSDLHGGIFSKIICSNSNIDNTFIIIFRNMFYFFFLLKYSFLILCENLIIKYLQIIKKMIKCYTYRSRFMLCDLVKERKKDYYENCFLLCCGTHRRTHYAWVNIRTIALRLWSTSVLWALWALTNLYLLISKLL